MRRWSARVALVLTLISCTSGSVPVVLDAADVVAPDFGGGFGRDADGASVDAAGTAKDAPAGDPLEPDGAQGGLADTHEVDSPVGDVHLADVTPWTPADVGGPDVPVDAPPPIDVTPPDIGTFGALVQAPPLLLDTHPTVNYRGVDAAWDATAGAFLFVYGNAPIGGAWVGADGGQVGSGFLLTGEPYDGGNWTQNPRVSPSDGGSLVSWHEELPGGPIVQVRRVRKEGDGPAFDGPPVTVSAPGSNQESAAALGYAPELNEHLVVWAAAGLHARRLAPSGEPLAGEVPVSEPGVWVEFPSVVWHPGCGCWFVAFMQEVEPSGHVLLLRVGADGLPLGPPDDLTGPIGFAKVTDVELDTATEEVVATWYEVRDGVAGFAAQRFGAAGVALSLPQTVFAPFGSYDGYDLAYSAITGTCLAAFHGPDVAAFASELAPDLGYSAPFPLNLGGSTFGAYLPRVVAHPDSASWLVAFSPDYTGVIVQRVFRE